MSLIKCTECGKEISDKATVCPNCGLPLVNDNVEDSSVIEVQGKKQKKGVGVKILISAIAVIVLALIIGVVMHNANVAKENALLEKQAKQFSEKITAIEGRISYEQKELDELQAEYDALTEQEKKMVKNYKVLANIMDTPTEAERGAIEFCEQLKRQLRNPDSLIISEIMCKEPADNSNTYGYTMNFSAQNGFGGYKDTYTSFVYDKYNESAHGDAFSDAVSRIHLSSYLENPNPEVELDKSRIEKFLNE